MHLLKYLQAQGLGSRKQCQWLINAGCVTVNGQPHTHAKTDINPDAVQQLHIDGRAVTVVPQPFFYLRLHKPAGYETSHKPQHHPSVFGLLPDNLRQLPMQAVGRLDADTTGVLLITNDGQFNHRLTSPRRQVAKLYRVGLKHPADDKLCRQLLHGVLLHDDNETVAAAAAELDTETTLLLTITSGRYHQVKRMVAAAGNRVASLHRLRFDQWDSEDLQPGQWRFFHPEHTL